MQKREQSLQRQNKWKFPSLMSILSPQSKVTSTRSKSFLSPGVRSRRNVYLSSSFGTSRDQSVHSYNNRTGFTWNPFAARSFDSSNITDIRILQSNDTSQENTAIASRRPSSPLLIKSRNQSSVFNTPSTTSSSFNNSLDDQTIRANQYLYNLATWRMYKRIENARAHKRRVEGINVNHIPNAYIPGNEIGFEGNPEEKENMQLERNFDRSHSENENDDPDGDEHSIQFHIDL